LSETKSAAESDSKSDDIKHFTDPNKLLAYVTANWQQHWVIAELWDYDAVEIFSRRPFFLLVSIDAPITLRYARHAERCKKRKQAVPSLDTFVENNDRYVFAHPSGLARITHRAKLSLLNDSNDLDGLYKSLRQLDLLNESRLRPSWDQYFMELADLAAQRSNCMKRLVGCVLVREKRVVSTGYNGTPRGMTNCNQGGCKCSCYCC
jgi:dCMP deaminase